MRGFRSILGFCAALVLAGPAGAFHFVESTDAGQLPGTAKGAVGTGALESISGTLAVGGDIDLFRIAITDPGAFSATTVGTAAFDTQLWLFRLDGTGIASNDDTGLDLGSTLPVGNVLYSGLLVGEYLIGISAFNNDPFSGLTAMFGGCGFSAVCGPSVAGPLTGWSTSSAATGAYTIRLTGAGGVIPEPTAALLFALGFGVIGGTRRTAR